MMSCFKIDSAAIQLNFGRHASTYIGRSACGDMYVKHESLGRGLLCWDFPLYHYDDYSICGLQGGRPWFCRMDWWFHDTPAVKWSCWCSNRFIPHQVKPVVNETIRNSKADVGEATSTIEKCWLESTAALSSNISSGMDSARAGYVSSLMKQKICALTSRNSKSRKFLFQFLLVEIVLINSP